MAVVSQAVVFQGEVVLLQAAALVVAVSQVAVLA
jgi:hypothetical protein